MNLTEKQENFAVEYIRNGRNATEAYRAVYDTKTNNPNTVWRAAHDVLQNSKVATRIKELRMASFSKHIMTVEERKQMLTELALDGDIKSIDMLNKMDGVYIEKQEIKAEVTEVKSGVGELYKAMNDE